VDATIDQATAGLAWRHILITRKEVGMRSHRIALGLVPLLLIGCDQRAAVGPEISPDLQPEFCYTDFPEGRMTGGGVIRLSGYVNGEEVGIKFTHGFTLHCDIELSNNLEINWGGNQWHIEKESLEHVECLDEPDVNPEPPPAPFDTFIAAATGRLNGEWGSHIAFTLQDAGEPGGKSDKAGLAIWDVGADPHTTDPIIVVPFDYIENGNIQAHYDQPHGNKP
jgi:hypothetical protein